MLLGVLCRCAGCVVQDSSGSGAGRNRLLLGTVAPQTRCRYTCTVRVTVATNECIAGSASGGAAPADPQPAGDVHAPAHVPGSLEARAGRIAARLSDLFPLWVALASGLGLAHPPALAWFRAEYTTAALALTMLAMGTSLTFQVRLLQ